MTSENLAKQIKDTIHNIPDFPKKGIQFKDISPIFLFPELYKDIIREFSNFSRDKIDAVCGIESRGFLFGISIAVSLGVPFILVRKKGKLPPPFVAEKYELEYGFSEIEMKEGQLQKGQRVLIHDDLLATGGTTEAAARLVEKQGAVVSQFSFLVELDELKGREKLQKFGAELHSLVQY